MRTYGTIDVLLLTILPVDAVRRALSRRPVSAGVGGAAQLANRSNLLGLRQNRLTEPGSGVIFIFMEYEQESDQTTWVYTD